MREPDFFIENNSFHSDSVSATALRDRAIHKKYGMHFQLSGECRCFIGNSSFTLHAGELVFFDGEPYKALSSVSDCEYFFAGFDEGYLSGFENVFGRLKPLELFRRGSDILYFADKDADRLCGLFTSLLELEGDASDFAQALRRLVLAQLLLFALCAQSETRSRPKPNSLIDGLDDYIQRHYSEKLTLSEIAAQYYITPTYLCRLFKKLHGLTLGEYITSVRVNRAAAMLEASNDKISDIAAQCGFGSDSQFTRSFKKTAGTSPQEYRRLYAKPQRG